MEILLATSDAMAAHGDEALISFASLIALFTLTILEIVLGIDNIVFIALLTGRLPEHQQKKARRLGLAGAMVVRILLLLVIGWVMTLVKPLITFGEFTISGKDLILLGGGLFLIFKATYEIHERIEESAHPADRPLRTKAASFGGVIAQIMLIDIVFSLDSVITAVGMARHVPIMIAAVIIAVAVMMIFAEPVSRFIRDHPTMKILALSFLLLIGVMLVSEGFHKHIEKGYIYFAMGFSLLVESVNLWIAKRRKNQALVDAHAAASAGGH